MVDRVLSQEEIDDVFRNLRETPTDEDPALRATLIDRGRLRLRALTWRATAERFASGVELAIGTQQVPQAAA